MAKTIAICNQKGGVGKTTTTLNIGVGMARQDKRVLLVDADPQSDLTEIMIERGRELSLYSVISCKYFHMYKLTQLKMLFKNVKTGDKGYDGYIIALFGSLMALTAIGSKRILKRIIEK